MERPSDINLNAPPVTDKVSSSSKFKGHSTGNADQHASQSSEPTPKSQDASRQTVGSSNSPPNRDRVPPRKRLKTDHITHQSANTERYHLPLACPISKHCEVNNISATCTFDGRGSMFHIRRHINSGAHNRNIRYLRLCRNCWEDVIDPQEFQNVHDRRLCRSTTQPRGSKRVSETWVKLYRKLYPHAELIPSPCRFATL